jgi:hypothetical protein
MVDYDTIYCIIFLVGVYVSTLVTVFFVSWLLEKLNRD